MNTTVWRTEIHCSLTRSEVVNTVQRFLDSLRGSELSLAPELTPSVVKDADEVSAWAWKLMAASIEANHNAALSAMCSVFAEAKKRLELLALVRRAHSTYV